MRVGIVGASGYSGMVATRILAQHPNATLTFCTSDKWAGEAVGTRVGATLRDTLVFLRNDQAALAAAEVDVVLLATPAEVSHDLVPKLLTGGASLVDLSGAFRLRNPSLYPAHYAFEHQTPTLLASSHYGLPELFAGLAQHHRGSPQLVANPGCFPTATLLALVPLLRANLIEEQGLIVDAKTGVTGAGRRATEAYSFCELDGDLRAYKVLSHQHTPEIAQALGNIPLTFTAHLIPVKRGLLATCYARPKPGVTTAMLKSALQESYKSSPFVRVGAPDEASFVQVVGTNHCVIGVASNEDVVVVTSAIDNLVKGAAGQAIQNMNILFGLPQTTGLDTLSRSAP